jgi:Dolichyl-phosphate-mannose-protein mannosyltransferase
VDAVARQSSAPAAEREHSLRGSSGSPARTRASNLVRSLSQSGRSAELVLVGITWFVSAVWVWFRLDEGWYPHDDGAFAQSAVRVLDGQLPHREFAELYTGAMTFLDAGVFYVLGEDLFNLRVPLFLLFLGFVPCVYYITRQFVGPVPAALTSLAAVTWGFPVYPVPMPTWYVLFFTIYGAAALVRWRQTGNLRWLFVAGLLGGLAIAFKIIGVYYVAAVCLFVLCCGPRTPANDMRSRRRQPVASFVGPAAGVAFAAFLVGAVFGSRIGIREIVSFIAPIAVLSAAVLLWPEVTQSKPARIRAQAGRLGVFALGVTVPLSILAIPYVWAGALSDLVEGVFVSPQSRRDYAYLAMPGPAELFPAVVIVGVLLLRRRVAPRVRNLLDAAIGALAALVLVTAFLDPAAYLLYFSSGRGMATVAVVVGSVALIRRCGSAEPHRSELLVLLLGLVAFTALVQFPHAGPVYYFYVAPLAAVATVALLAPRERGPGVLPAVLLVAFIAFGAAFLDRSSLSDLGVRAPGLRTEVLGEKASIRVGLSDKRQFGEVVSLLQRHARGAYVYAGPDLPHVYFLSGFDNPTRSLFDFLDTTDSARARSLVDNLVARRVTAIAINTAPDISDPLEPAVLRELGRMYPHGRRVGNIEVRWAAA